MRLDLHCHSTCSDGSLAPAEVARAALAGGARLFCLTDHDTLQGGPAVAEALAGAPCAVLRGLELSCNEGGRTIHLLIYGVGEGPGMDALAERLVEVDGARRRRLVAIVDRLAGLGIELDAAAILTGAHGHTPGRPDVARALRDAGVVSSLREAFDRFLHDGGPADVPIDRLGLGEGLELGRACGAKMSLAHPHTLRSPPLVADLYTRFQGAGLGGIEAFYGRYGPSERLGWCRLAEDRGLVVTGGSDFHGEAVPQVSRPTIDLPARHAARLCEWLEVEAPSG
ncbi:MAG: PHP domain-containing protein [Myxococcales bacterium]|nr:PHP domain-containing protein [Myxococcales bacterium]MCB9703971.1 PHP domain-containing protein [Myxococcales bacterium]